MESRTFYYARVSSREQNLDRQIASFTALGAQERDIITDKESGKDLNRTGYTALKTTLLRRGDTLVIKSLDRLSRNKSDIKQELEYFKNNGIRLKVLDLPTTMIDYPAGQEWVLDMVNNILIEVLASIADAVDGSMKILVDGGIRDGVDVFKALALGADAVIMARPFVNAIYQNAAEGVQRLTDKIRGELADTMAMCGTYSLEEIDRSMIFGY